MANPTVTVANFTVNRGGKFVFTDTQLAGADADSDLDHFVCSTLPTHGTLELDGEAVTLTTEILAADITASKLVYYHDGSANADAVSFKAVDAADGLSAAGNITVTSTDNHGWIALVKPFDHAPQVPLIASTQVEALAVVADWQASHSGSAEVLIVPTTLTITVLAKDNAMFAADVVQSPFADKLVKIVGEMKRRMVDVLNDGSNADLLTLVNANGGNMAYPGRVVMTPAQQRRWNAVCDAINEGNLRRRFVEINDFANALEELKGALA